MACQCPLFKVGTVVTISLILLASSFCLFNWSAITGQRIQNGTISVNGVNTTYSIYQRIERDLGIFGACNNDYYRITVGTNTTTGPFKHSCNKHIFPSMNLTWIFGSNNSFPFPAPLPPVAPSGPMSNHSATPVPKFHAKPHARNPFHLSNCHNARDMNPLEHYTDSFSSILPSFTYTVNKQKSDEYRAVWISAASGIASLALVLLLCIIRGIANVCCNIGPNPNRCSYALIAILTFFTTCCGGATLAYHFITIHWLQDQTFNMLVDNVYVFGMMIDTTTSFPLVPVHMKWSIGYATALFAAGIILSFLTCLQSITACCCNRAASRPMDDDLQVGIGSVNAYQQPSYSANYYGNNGNTSNLPYTQL